jgi:ERCC4-type nuclease
MSEKIVVQYDSREPEEYVNKLRAMLPELEFERHTLPVGDYIIRGVVIERKSASDYIASLTTDNRLNNQLVNLSYNFELSYLVVIGFPYIIAESYNVLRKSITSSLLGCSFKRYQGNEGANGVVVTVQVETDQDFADMLESLSKKERIRIPKIKKVKFSPGEEMIATLSTFPNWGPKISKAALEAFGTLEAVLSATPESLRERVENCGPVKSESIQKHLKEKYVE